jgi:hypothetical protein
LEAARCPMAPPSAAPPTPALDNLPIGHAADTW